MGERRINDILLAQTTRQWSLSGAIMDSSRQRLLENSSGRFWQTYTAVVHAQPGDLIMKSFSLSRTKYLRSLGLLSQI
jgi:hypothetical protein